MAITDYSEMDQDIVRLQSNSFDDGEYLVYWEAAVLSLPNGSELAYVEVHSSGPLPEETKTVTKFVVYGEDISHYELQYFASDFSPNGPGFDPESWPTE